MAEFKYFYSSFVKFLEVSWCRWRWWWRAAAECRHMTDRVSRPGRRAAPHSKYYGIFYTQGNTTYFYNILLLKIHDRACSVFDTEF